VTSRATPDAYFARWIRHETWSAWSPDTEWARVAGPVAVGIRGVLKPRRGPKAKFVICVCAPDKEYTDTTPLPGARLVSQHTVEPAEQGSDLRVRITMQGPLAFLWAKVMGGGLQDSAQADLDRLVRLVRLVEQP